MDTSKLGHTWQTALSGGAGLLLSLLSVLFFAGTLANDSLTPNYGQSFRLFLFSTFADSEQFM